MCSCLADLQSLFYKVSNVSGILTQNVVQYLNIIRINGDKTLICFSNDIKKQY